MLVVTKQVCNFCSPVGVTVSKRQSWLTEKTPRIISCQPYNLLAAAIRSWAVTVSCPSNATERHSSCQQRWAEKWKVSCYCCEAIAEFDYFFAQSLIEFLLCFQVNGPETPVQNGVDLSINPITQGVGELNFEEEEEDQFYMKDLPKYACAWVLICSLCMKRFRKR